MQIAGPTFLLSGTSSSHQWITSPRKDNRRDAVSYEYTDHMHAMRLRKSTRMSRFTRQGYDACDKATQHYTNELLDIDNCWHYSNLILFFPCAWSFCSYQRILVHFFSKQASTINWNIARSIQLV